LKRLNLITKEVNLNENQTKNISLFFESDEQLEYVLDLDEQAPPAAPVPAPVPPTDMPPAPEGDMPPAPEGDVPPMPEEPMPELEEPMDMEDEEDEDETVTFKTIQKTTGKLAQKIRTFLSNEENEMTSQDTKYVINSVLSALDLSTLDDDDMDEIMAKFEGEEGGEEMPEMGSEEPPMDEPPMDEPPMPDESMTPPPPAPEGGEMAEYRVHGARKNRHQSVEEVFEEVFSESKVDKVLGKYFDKKQQPKSTNNVVSKIQHLSESFKQEVQSVKFINENNDFKLLGKNKQGYLVFENEYERVRVSPKGNVI